MRFNLLLPRRTGLGNKLTQLVDRPPPLRNGLLIMDDVLTLELPAIFPVTKDRPVLFSALAWSDALITLDRQDFVELLGREFYGLAYSRQRISWDSRAAGRLKT